LARLEGFRIDLKGNDPIFEIGGFREIEVEVAKSKGIDDPGIAHVVAWRDIPSGYSEGEFPGEQKRAGWDVSD
jgi:hypothetical protein